MTCPHIAYDPDGRCLRCGHDDPTGPRITLDGAARDVYDTTKANIATWEPAPCPPRGTPTKWAHRYAT